MTRQRADQADGLQLRVARERKETKYHELFASGRWSDEAVRFVRALAKAKARSYPAVLRRSVQLAYTRRWTGLLAVAAQRAFAATLLELPVDEAGCDGDPPPVEAVLREARLVEAPSPSRLPAGG